jgi:eukaryotic-like serine/threonine-protein kinase
MRHLPDRTLRHLRHVTKEHHRYEIGQEIGRGGMGIVYKAWDSYLERTVALKVASAPVKPEACILAGLEHPGIVPVYDAGVLPDGRHYYVMRLVEGKRLDEFLRLENSLAARLRVFLRICEAVGFAHSRAVIHCDLKPRNIMVGNFGEVFVMDWGIARSAGSTQSTNAGTPHYMAPESVDRSGLGVDVFSLGRILDDSMREMSPRPLVAIAKQASAPDPENRYHDVASLAADVANFLDRLPVAAYRESALESAFRFASRNRVLLLLLVSYVLVRFALFFIRR